MKDNQAKYPQLRFKGFTDPWVQRNLADLSDGFSYGLNAAAKEYDGVHGYLRITDIDEVSHSFLPEGLTSPDVPEDQLTDYRMDEQSIVYARTGASTGKTYIYRDSDGELYYAGFLIRQKVNKETSAQFVYQNTLTKAWERYVQVMSQRSGQPGINAQEVGRFELAIPEKAEQDKIAHLFNSLDNLIAANQRKLDLLKEQKKGYLQKMFPKNGAKVPELRFAGFADAWEQRKLGDITKISTGKLDANAMVENGKYDFYTSGIKKYRIDVAAFEGPSITIAGNGATVGYMHLADNKFNAYQRTYVLQEFLVDRSFIFSEIGNKLPKKIKQEVRTGNIPYIVMDMLTELKLSIPQNNSEQQKIGSLFKQLDDTIDLHQRKLEKLQELKKGYLQKMFC
ncbi:restriction endonuclease subunit S [Pediococcus acidilactici]|uniref:restriction endonuclease subunit S n=1 Tax=Pediococcus acidilactici TaxID=1254 RepID=UPI0013208195|nr:restriction endonuclease subunit S [Pediococcus acidilactici]KAF0338036.1 restriction endonuclease subunit S [Pediococcus acidilactici]KAF0377946.1 restriction endonuclease subunit S [Pediococcus acidilactici]KAF0388242.1 restriction endonuclease subunit S [Pediococcus acidilactici]KAF0459920.1 restriction endonuclease subunit S [Pediococcus acidilactici]KAF0533408.1 restriction endonuclease subunit S [Pediococcus acidilactici]